MLIFKQNLNPSKMKKVIYVLFLVLLIFQSCQENVNEPVLNQQVNVDMSDFYLHTEDNENGSSKSGEIENKNFTRKNCNSMSVLNRQLKENPSLYNKMYDIEYNTRKFLALKKGNGNGGGNNGGDNGGGTPIDDGLGIINIPVYVHVVYSNSNENISDQQIASQISVLNDDFRRQNNDAVNTPSEFLNRAADAEITFSLAGTFRYSNSRTSWGTNDIVKATYPPVTPQTHLNVWVCNIGGGILGYAQFPGGNSATDGVVCAPQYFGTTGFVASPFDGGRTMTHEVGHYLNLRHIWGDGRCRQDDFVTDTPSSDGPNYGCPSYPTVNCRSNDMTMNYMDYTNDACMNIFTEGQKQRMRAVFVNGGPRSGIVSL